MKFEIIEGNHYKNIKNEETYIVLYKALSAWDINQNLIVYRNLNNPIIWVRSETEFCEKFEKL
jgi:hypothetical protein